MPDQSSAASEHALMQEITAPLETLPDDPLSIVEAEFPTAMRGYDRHAVDDYVEQVARLVAELHATRSPEAAVRRALERVGDQISGVLQRAHQTAEQITSQSRVEAEDRLEQARREAATMIEAAEQRVRELDADTDHIWGERQRIIGDAEDLAEQLRAVAREAAERFPDDDARGATSVEDHSPIAEPDAASPAPGAAPGLDPAMPASEVAAASEVEATWAYDPLEGPDATRTEDPDGPHDLDDADGPVHPIGPDAGSDAGLGMEGEGADDEDIEATRAFEPLPRRITDEDSTQIIPPSSDAAQHRRDG